jgi:DNA invertase Pin-like site-specific DNA recombinase
VRTITYLRFCACILGLTVPSSGVTFAATFDAASETEHKMTPNTQRFIAYYRVSTKRQGLSGLGLDAQRESVAAYLAGVRGKLVEEFTEVEHGTRKGNHRPQLAAALAQCRVHGATLIIAKLDRLARNVAFVSNLMEANVDFTACDFPQANRLTIHILAAVAEHEAEMISTRTKLALAAAKRKGTALGGDRGNCAQIARKGNKASIQVRSAQAQRRASDLLPVIETIKAEGAQSLRQIAQGLNQRGILTARGGEWSAAQVLRIMEHATA